MDVFINIAGNLQLFPLIQLAGGKVTFYSGFYSGPLGVIHETLVNKKLLWIQEHVKLFRNLRSDRKHVG